MQTMFSADVLLRGASQGLLQAKRSLARFLRELNSRL